MFDDVLGRVAPDIRFRLPDIRLKNCLKTNKIKTKPIPEKNSVFTIQPDIRQKSDQISGQFSIR